MDNGKGDGVCASVCGEVHEDGGKGDGGAAHQISRDMPTNSDQHGLVPGTLTRDRPS